MKTFVFVVFFLLLGAFFIISEQEIYLSSEGGVEDFFISYGQWIEGLIDNGKGVSGYMIKMDWLPDSGSSVDSGGSGGVLD